MSEFLCCYECGDLSMFANVEYVNNQPICPTCQEKNRDISVTINLEEK